MWRGTLYPQEWPVYVEIANLSLSAIVGCYMAATYGDIEPDIINVSPAYIRKLVDLVWPLVLDGRALDCLKVLNATVQLDKELRDGIVAFKCKDKVLAILLVPPETI